MACRLVYQGVTEQFFPGLKIVVLAAFVRKRKKGNDEKSTRTITVRKKRLIVEKA